MKKFRVLILSAFSLLVIHACKNGKEKVNTAENNIDAARNFIRAALDGKFDLARTFMVPDSVNTNYMDVAERSFQKADKTTKEGYRTASIRILSSSVINPADSATIVIYSNSYKNDPDTLKVIRQNGQWLVDLKYLYEHDMDTSMKKPLLNDSLQ